VILASAKGEEGSPAHPAVGSLAYTVAVGRRRYRSHALAGFRTRPRVGLPPEEDQSTMIFTIGYETIGRLNGFGDRKIERSAKQNQCVSKDSNKAKLGSCR
jgi:hypothetical protein